MRTSNRRIETLIFKIVKTIILISSTVFLLDGCANKSNNTTDNKTAALSVTPTNAVISPYGTVTLVANGGTSPYTYSLSSGSSLGTISSTTGVFISGGSTGTVVATISDATGASVSSVLEISTSTSSTGVSTSNTGTLTLSPVNATIAINQSLVFSTSGGVAPLYL